MAKSILKKIEKVEIVAIFVLLASMVGLATYMLTIKLIDHAFGAGLESLDLKNFVDSFLKVSLYWLGLIGGSMAIADRKNIAIDLLQQFASMEQRIKIDKYINILSAVISALLFVVCYWFWTSLFDIAIVKAEGEIEKILYFNVFSRAIFPVYFAIFVVKFILASQTDLEPESFEG